MNMNLCFCKNPSCFSIFEQDSVPPACWSAFPSKTHAQQKPLSPEMENIL